MRWIWAALAMVAVAPSAYAGDVLSIELVPKAQKGQGDPALVVHALSKLKSVEINLVRRSDGKKIARRAGPIASRDKHSFELPLRKIGNDRYEGKLSVVAANGTSGDMPIGVDVELVGALQLKVAAEDLDLKKKTIRIESNRPVKKVQVALMSDSGAQLGTTVHEVEPNTVASVPYQLPAKATLMRISITAWDESNFYGGIALFPWRVDIPHEEVNFASGSSDVDKTEIAKLEASFEKVTDAVRKYGKLASIRLFIGGHTDTVADAAFNRQLSDARARAIGRWFRKRGVKIPILYAGFGEDALVVETPDNTDEARNRRAEYIVAVDAPPVSAKVRWKPL